ncbi:MAG: BrnA antitoxin family protein [Deltaproteobacteria bacterium]|nr:BrnA antitoxin family protein [Deltaproteobacteria bacterium]
MWPDKKKQITIRLDPDVVEFFKGRGWGYQSSINAALRRYMEVHQRRLKST